MVGLDALYRSLTPESPEAKNFSTVPRLIFRPPRVIFWPCLRLIFRLQWLVLRPPRLIFRPPRLIFWPSWPRYAISRSFPRLKTLSRLWIFGRGIKFSATDKIKKFCPRLLSFTFLFLRNASYNLNGFILIVLCYWNLSNLTPCV